MPEKRKNVSRNGLYPPKEYQSAHLYIVDDIDPDAVPRRQGRRRRLDAHTHKCNIIREFFGTYTNCEVHSVRFPQGTTGRGFLNYWRQELQTKTSDDILIIYFHGIAGGEEREYTWTMSQYPRIAINAHSLIKMISMGNADSYFILDCFIHTRMTNKRRWRRATGNTEIVARPERMQSPDGRPMEHDGDFTEALVENLETFVDEIRGRFKGHKKMKSIPDILRYDDGMYSNPLRIWLNRTKYGGKTVVKRFRFDPIRVRRDGRLEFLTVIIQGPPEDEIAEMVRAEEEERRAAREGDGEREGSHFDDEGFEEMDEDDADRDEDEDSDGDEGGDGDGNGAEDDDGDGTSNESGDGESNSAGDNDGDGTGNGGDNVGSDGNEEGENNMFVDD